MYMAIIFELISRAATASHTAAQTRKLHPMPLSTTTPHLRDVFLIARLIEYSTIAGVSVYSSE